MRALLDRIPSQRRFVRTFEPERISCGVGRLRYVIVHAGDRSRSVDELDADVDFRFDDLSHQLRRDSEPSP
jgi:hypothetical protein